MKTIWKFPFETTDMFRVAMPKNSKILDIQVQDGIPCMWALVDTDSIKHNRAFFIHGTGHEVSQVDDKKYIGTYQERGGSLVWHVFELVERYPNE